MQDEINIIGQPNKFKWRENPPRVNQGEMRAAIACANKADQLECECWNEKCPYHGDCRSCMVYELSIKQFPTCERDLYDQLVAHHAAHGA